MQLQMTLHHLHKYTPLLTIISILYLHLFAQIVSTSELELELHTNLPDQDPQPVFDHLTDRCNPYSKKTDTSNNSQQTSTPKQVSPNQKTLCPTYLCLYRIHWELRRNRRRQYATRHRQKINCEAASKCNLSPRQHLHPPHRLLRRRTAPPRHPTLNLQLRHLPPADSSTEPSPKTHH